MNRYSTMQWRRMVVTFVFAVLLGLPQVSQARTIELGDNSIVKIDGVECNMGEPWPYPDNTIEIDSIRLTYNEHQKDSLSISCDGEIIYSDIITNILNPTEIKKANSNKAIKLSKGKEYTFSHGGRTWTLSFEEDIPDSTKEDQDTKSPQEKGDDGVDGNESHNLWTWILWGIVVLLVLGLACGVCFNKDRLVKLFKKLFRKEDKPSGTPPAAAGEESHEPAAQSDQDKDKEIGNQNDQLKDIVSKVDAMLDGEGVGLPIEERLERLKNKVSLGKAAIDDLDTVKGLLGLSLSKGREHIIEKIQELQESTSDTPKTKSEGNEEGKTEGFAQKCVDKVKESKNNALKALMNKAEEEAREKDKPTKVIEKFIELLRSQYKEDTPGKGTQSLEITDSQLQNPTNRLKVMTWLIEQLGDRGYDGFKTRTNKRPDVNLDELANRLKQNQDADLRPSDEEIVSQAIKDKKLTDEQKGILLKGLIEIINQKLDDSHKLTDTTTEAFVQSMVAKINMPNTHEEAIKKERQLILSLVNDVLGSDMIQLDADGLRSAQANALLKSLKEKIDGLEADNLDEALKELSTKAKQSKELADLLNKFKAESADELGEAIRKEQYESMSKSITYKLESLLPGQHIDSEQQLVNALIKLAEDSKEEVSSVTKDLNEKLSSIGGTHKDGEKPTQLLYRYTSLLKDKEKKLTDDIKEKTAEVERLKETNAEGEKKITELEEANGNLMSATQSMLDELHAYANELGSERHQILLSCSPNEEAQCEDIEDRLYESLDNVATRLKAFAVPDGTTPAEAKKEIQRELVDIVKEENNPIDKICRYYAYSRLPFMTDDSRDYGVKFNRSNMSALYAAVNNLFVAFGISFDIPALFVMGVKESGCEDLTGKKYGDLDNLCPNSCNHVGNIDTQNKPANVVVDIVNVGYTVDGKKETTTSVITY